LASAAVVSILAAGAIFIWSSKRGNSRATLLAKYSMFALLVIPPVCFARWYYTAEFHRLSPEIADVGLAAIWTDWLIGALLVLTLATIGAYHIGRMGNKAAEITADISHNLERTAFHESFLCLAIIGIKGIAMVGLYIASAISAYSMFGRSPPVWSYATLMLSNPPSLLALALMIATFQIIWARWRSRTGKVAWKLRGLSRSAFLRNAAALTILLIVAIPTLNAFAFILWLGPWNLLRLFGY
jgi:hypothetical protein